MQNVVTTWSVAHQRKVDLGAEISLTFLAKSPKFKTHFKRLRQINLDEIKRKTSFIDHSIRVMNRLRVTVACLTSDGGEEEILTVWRETAEIHRKYKIPIEAFSVSFNADKAFS